MKLMLNLRRVVMPQLATESTEHTAGGIRLELTHKCDT